MKKFNERHGVETDSGIFFPQKTLEDVIDLKMNPGGAIAQFKSAEKGISPISNSQMSHMDLSFPMVIFNVSYFEIKKMTISPNSLCNECSGSYPQLICPISCNYVSSMIFGSNFMSGTTLTRHT